MANVELDFDFDCNIDAELESLFVDMPAYVVQRVLRSSTTL